MRQRTGRKENELGDMVHSLRALCLRSFPEFLMEIKQAGIPPPPSAKQIELGTGVADITKLVRDSPSFRGLSADRVSFQTINYLNQIPDVQVTVTQALKLLGDGNWKMGEGTTAVSKTNALDIPDQSLLEHFARKHDNLSILFMT